MLEVSNRLTMTVRSLLAASYNKSQSCSSKDLNVQIKTMSEQPHTQTTTSNTIAIQFVKS